MTSRLANWALWGAGVGTAALIAGASLHLDMFSASPAAANNAAAPQAVPVTVSTVKEKKVATWQEFSGRLEAVDRVQLRPRVSGAIQAVHFREGGLVKAGDLLITLDPEPYKAAVAQAEGQVASARARVSLAQSELDRGKVLSENRTISQSDLAQRLSAHSEASANLQSAEAALKSAQLDLDYTQIHAPISGRVGRIEVTVGNLVAAGSAASPLTTLVSTDPIYASFDANEELVSRLLAQIPAKDGMRQLDRIPVEIGTLADNGTPIKGKLQLVDNEVNAASGTIRLRAQFDNPDGQLIPGQFVRVRLGEPEAADHLLVSERAIGTDQDRKFVFVVGADNTVAYRQVELGLALDGMRIVNKGLDDGDRIIVNGLQRVRPGALVDPKVEDAKVAQQ